MSGAEVVLPSERREATCGRCGVATLEVPLEDGDGRTTWIPVDPSTVRQRRTREQVGQRHECASADTDPELLRYDPFRGDESTRGYPVPKGKRPVPCKRGCGASIVWLDHDTGDGCVWLPLDMGTAWMHRDPSRRPRDRGHMRAEVHRCRLPQ